MNQTSIDFSSNHKESFKKPSRTVSASYRERSSKIHKEIAQANEARLLKEVERPKILIEETTLSKPKPPTFYISKAKENYQKKSSSKASSVSIDRKKLFGQLLSTQIFRKSEKLKILNSETKTQEKLVSKSFQTEILPSWLLERPDYQAAVKKIQSADSNVSTICGILPFNRTEDEKNAFFK